MPPAPTPPPKLVSDLTAAQMRHLLIAKLPPSVGVDCWGATRETMLEIAEENGVRTLGPADLEEIGPADAVFYTVNGARGERGRPQRRARRAPPDAGGQQWKLWLQMVITSVAVLAHGGRLNDVKQWFGLAPTLPACPPPSWWQRLAPWEPMPGAKGECVPKKRTVKRRR